MRDDGKRERGSPVKDVACCRRKDFPGIGRVISDLNGEVVLEGLMSGELSRWVLIRDTGRKTEWYQKL